MRNPGPLGAADKVRIGDQFKNRQADGSETAIAHAGSPYRLLPTQTLPNERVERFSRRGLDLQTSR